MYSIIKFFILCTLFCLASCSTTTTQPFAISSENAWFLETNNKNETTPIFCMANKKDNTADPVCYKAEKKDFESKNMPTESSKRMKLKDLL